MNTLLKTLIIVGLYVVGFIFILIIGNLTNISYTWQLIDGLIYGGIYGYFLLKIWKFI